MGSPSFTQEKVFNEVNLTEAQEGDSGAIVGISLQTAQGSLVLQLNGSVRSQHKERAPAQHWSFRTSSKNYSFKHCTGALQPFGQPAATLSTGGQRHKQSQHRSRASRAEPQPPARGWMQRHAGERSLYSSALQGSLRCWHSLTQFPPPPCNRYSHISPSSSCSLWEPLAVPRIIFICN